MKQNVKDELLDGFSDRFKQSLKRAGIKENNAEVARIFGLSRPMIVAYLSGKSLPSVAQAIEIAKKLQVDFDWLMTGRSRTSEPPEIKAYIMKDALQALSDAKEFLGKDISIETESLMLIALYQYIDLTQLSGKAPDFDACLTLVRALLSGQPSPADNSKNNLKSAS